MFSNKLSTPFGLQKSASRPQLLHGLRQTLPMAGPGEHRGWRSRADPLDRARQTINQIGNTIA
jgi:hypothetical protein